MIHTDDLLAGWEGLPGLPHTLTALLAPLHDDQPGSYRRYDWERREHAEEVAVDPGPLLVLEGVGSGPLLHAPLVTVLAWVEVPYDLRMARGLERGGIGVAQHWRQWAVDEQEVFARERTRERADVVLDGRVGSLGG